MDKAIIKDHFEHVAEKYDYWKEKNSYYYDTLKRFYRSWIRDSDSVIDFGCGTGGVLSSMPGARKTGLDITEAMIARARVKHPDIEFHVHDAEEPFAERGAYDVAIMSDIIDHITDILKLYANANGCLRIGGRVCISTINPLWDPIFLVAEKLGQKMPEGQHNFVPNRDLIAFLKLRGFRLVSSGALMLVPRYIPLVSGLINALAPKTPLLNRLCAVQTIVAEKVSDYSPDLPTDLTCTVVIPCYNEVGNIEECVRQIPRIGKDTEIIIVDDGSKDGTGELARQIAARDPRVRPVIFERNQGKGKAVKAGFDAARGDVIMICDADMTVPPSELPLFFEPIAAGIADFTNGTRMIYPMQQQAMRFANLIGNFSFGVILSWLMGQRISDTLCGTKCMKKTDYAKIPMGQDPWGDFDFLFGAAELKLRIVEIPVHYQARTEGLSKMKPFKHAMILLVRCWQGFLRLKVRKR